MPTSSASHAAGSIRERLLAEAEIEAERTVAVLRMLMGAGLLALLVVALGGLAAPPPELMRRQAGMAVAVLVLYSALGVLSWRLARPGVLKPWMPWIFTTADAALLLFNVAFNADNLGVSLAFATAFPVLWLAPLVLSFTALRYRPGLQAYGGALIVGGLLALAAIEGAQPTGPAIPIATFAVPPNVMRLGMLAGFAAVLVLAAYRRRALLARAVVEAERRAEYQRYLPPPVAALVAAGEIDRLRRGWRIEAAIVLVDIRGFTSLAETLAADEVGRFVTAYRRRLTELVAEHGGLVDKFVGDGAVVLFGVLGDEPSAAARAVACAHRLPAALRRVEGRPVRLAIGAHWGEVFAGAVGDDARLEFTVLGDAVNVAARIEEVAKALDRAVVVSDALLEAAGGATAGWERLGERRLRGRSAAMRLWTPPAAG